MYGGDGLVFFFLTKDVQAKHQAHHEDSADDDVPVFFFFGNVDENHNENISKTMTEDVTKAMEKVSIAGKGTAKRDALRANEIEVQKQWEEGKAFEVNPSDDESKETFMVTFPYP